MLLLLLLLLFISLQFDLLVFGGNFCCRSGVCAFSLAIVAAANTLLAFGCCCCCCCGVAVAVLYCACLLHCISYFYFRFIYKFCLHFYFNSANDSALLQIAADFLAGDKMHDGNISLLLSLSLLPVALRLLFNT